MFNQLPYYYPQYMMSPYPTQFTMPYPPIPYEMVYPQVNLKQQSQVRQNPVEKVVIKDIQSIKFSSEATLLTSTKNKEKQEEAEELNYIITGHWSRDEHKRYTEFINKNKEIFYSKMLKKSHKIFKEMSKAVKTRTSTQCRSHHQKYSHLYKQQVQDQAKQEQKEEVP